MRLAALVLTLLPSAALACPVCFSKADNAGLIRGLNWGLFILLAATFSMMAGIAYAAVGNEKKRMERERAEGLFP